MIYKYLVVVVCLSMGWCDRWCDSGSNGGNWVYPSNPQVEDTILAK